MSADFYDFKRASAISASLCAAAVKSIFDVLRSCVAILQFIQPVIQLPDDGAIAIELLMGMKLIVMLGRADDDRFKHLAEIGNGPLAGAARRIKLVIPRNGDA